MSRRRGKHAARRPRRRMLLLSMGLAVGVFFAILFGNEFIRANPTVDPASDNEVSRDHTRSAPPSVAAPSVAPSVAAPPKPVRKPARPVAGLNQTQMNNVAIIVDVGLARNLPRQAAVVAVATALQESNLYNVASSAVPASLKYPHEGESVNYDSVGLFQQRASMGWGTVAQLMDPRYSTARFYDSLVKVSGWQGMSVTAAAQAVQKSAYPGAYQKHAETAKQAVDSLL